jgi:hypothetical protein
MTTNQAKNRMRIESKPKNFGPSRRSNIEGATWRMS